MTIKKPKSTGAQLPKTMSGAYPKAYIKNEDLRGTAHNVTIRAIDNYEHYVKGKGSSASWCLYFEGKDRYLILREAMARDAAKVLGTEDMSEWIGGEISIYPDTMTAGGKTHYIIDIQEPTKEAQKPEPPKPTKPVDQTSANRGATTSAADHE